MTGIFSFNRLRLSLESFVATGQPNFFANHIMESSTVSPLKPPTCSTSHFLAKDKAKSIILIVEGLDLSLSTLSSSITVVGMTHLTLPSNRRSSSSKISKRNFKGINKKLVSRITVLNGFPSSDPVKLSSQHSDAYEPPSTAYTPTYCNTISHLSTDWD